MLRSVPWFIAFSIAISGAMDLPLIPLPREIDQTGGNLILSGNVRFEAGKGESHGPALAMVTGALHAVGLTITDSDTAIPLIFDLSSVAKDSSDESYQLNISEQGITIRGSEVGVFRGATTLAQLIALTPKEAGKPALPCLEIKDSPRFSWRGFMLDESRFFAGEDEVTQLLDAMAFYKLNRFHWHLTDSPGWRIEIKAYPKLTGIGARGNEDDPEGKGEPAFYTQEQIRRIVRYGKERNIIVIPEIDMPGHADAAVRAYPELDGGGFEKKGQKGKWPRFTFNPGSPEVHAFRDQVLAEVAALFPDAGVIHGGGDEVYFGWSKWPELPDVRKLMLREDLADNAAVERWFGRKMAAKINGLGFKTGAWDEATAMNLPTDKTVIFWWRHDKPEVLHQALTDGYPVVLCPRRPLYFDFIQNHAHKNGRTWQGFNPMEDVYDFPASLKLPASQESGVIGIQACLWTEEARTRERREFLTWPRLVALAESGWTAEARKNHTSFEQRLLPHLDWLKARGITTYDPFKNSPEVSDATDARQASAPAPLIR